MGAIFGSLWRYRGFILGSVKREFQSKYRNSLLGASWTVINPLAMIVVYTVIFSQIMRAKLPGVDSTFAYSIYLCAGVLTWGLFAEITSRAQNTFLENANLLKKLSFPRLCLPVVVVANAALNFAIIFGLFTLFLLVSGNFPGVTYLAVFPLLTILSAFAIGLGITLGVLNVFFRDVGQFFGIFVQFWFWFTPIVYPVSILPPGVKDLIAYNPMVPLLAGFQAVLVMGQWPQWASLLYPTVLAALFCLLGVNLFRRHAGDMVDEL
jgi:lipopolysaccharide transport system permease protein